MAIVTQQHAENLTTPEKPAVRTPAAKPQPPTATRNVAKTPPAKTRAVRRQETISSAHRTRPIILPEKSHQAARSVFENFNSSRFAAGTLPSNYVPTEKTAAGVHRVASVKQVKEFQNKALERHLRKISKMDAPNRGLTIALSEERVAAPSKILLALAPGAICDLAPCSDLPRHGPTSPFHGAPIMTFRQFARPSFDLVFVAIVVALLLTASVTPMAHAQTFTVFHAFSGDDGGQPNGDLIRDQAGNFYGTTQSGQGSSLYGVVFKLDPSGSATVLYRFTNGADGAFPSGRLLRTNDGSLYGMTTGAGDLSCRCGTVFKLTTDGSLTVLHAFLGGGDGGQVFPLGGEVVRIGNALFGATYFGGDPACLPHLRSTVKDPGQLRRFSSSDPGPGCGVIFKLTPSGEETVLYRFSGGADGAFPRDLVADSAGNIFGVTESGYSAVSVNGAVFKLDNNTRQPVVLYNFLGGSDGLYPNWRLTVDVNEPGILYGTTIAGGSSGCLSGFCGVLFRLDTSDGAETVLHRFATKPGDGEQPSGAVLYNAGSLFGTTTYGGTGGGCSPLGCGVVYGNSSTGRYRLLHSFTGGVDGAAPNGALIQDSAGALYGAAAVGGAGNNGLIFKITQ
jgi:uncharacterized repeat protein (TIGR03803 family)